MNLRVISLIHCYVPDWSIRFKDVATHLPQPDGRRFVELLKRGTLSVELYAPRGDDPQKPHTRDELYVVAQGSGTFVRGADRVAFSAGDVLFVPAKMEHRFVDFTRDLYVWVMFYGPEGGEQAA
jgi:mannose-6-phosphate isomerase-like protein (cupin superfamily)